MDLDFRFKNHFFQIKNSFTVKKYYIRPVLILHGTIVPDSLGGEIWYNYNTSSLGVITFNITFYQTQSICTIKKVSVV